MAGLSESGFIALRQSESFSSNGAEVPRAEYSACQPARQPHFRVRLGHEGTSDLPGSACMALSTLAFADNKGNFGDGGGGISAVMIAQSVTSGQSASNDTYPVTLSSSVLMFSIVRVDRFA